MPLSGLYKEIVSGADSFLDRLFSYKGIEEDSLQFKKTYGLTAIIIIIYVAIMEWIVIHLEVASLVLYGALLEGWFIPFLVLFILLPYRLKWMVHLSSHLSMFITLFIIVRLGGIHQCGGVIFAPLMTVIISPLFRSIAWSIYYFLLFVAGVFLVVFLQLRWNLSPEMEPQVNQIIFLINTLGISGMIIREVLVYLRQYAEREKERANRLRELDEVKTKLYTNITHEFRTPLTLIMGSADQIESDPGQYMEQGIDGIRRNSKDLLHLVNQMLDLSRLEGGMVSLRMVHGDICPLLKVMLETFHVQAAERGLNLNLITGSVELAMDHDPEKLKQIVYNLLSNAIKYTPGPGNVTLWARHEENDPSACLIRVEDTGPGIPEEKLEKVFDRFYRIEREAGRTPVGSGLGLTITRELVQMLGGSMEISSLEKKGTVVTVLLPVTNLAPEATEEEADDPQEDKNMTIGNDQPIVLVVEDHAEVSEYLRSLLEDNYTVLQARDGQEGLEKAYGLVPDLVVSDVMMPNMDGIVMLEQLKNDFRTSHIPVILLTAKADVASRLEGLEAGADAYLAKPFNKEELYIRIRKLLEIRGKLKERYASVMIPEQFRVKQYEREDRFIARIHEVMTKNLSDERFGVEGLCTDLGMSRSQLYRKFKVLYEHGIRNYLITFRLHAAKQLLKESDLSVTQVAYEVGFKNLSHFSRKFRSVHGVSPGYFRDPQA
ncbi:MAG: ATP-binding protein [Bacteroidota bacterium]